jgi:lipid-A-disaccharide synthase
MLARAVDNPISGRQPKICVVAGEASGDAHCALLVKAIREFYPHAVFFGMGGRKLAEAGVELIVNSEHSAALMGFTELIGSFRKIYQSFRKIQEECRRRSPDLVVLVDYPDFNLRLAKQVKTSSTKVLYFIGPQLWAWRSGRVKTVRKYVDAVAAIFPFEEDFYHRHGVRAEYVGHPFLNEPFPAPDRERFFAAIGARSLPPTVAMLPGSRRAEIELLLPEMVAALRSLKRIRPGIQALLPIAPGISKDRILEIVGDESGIVIVEGQAREILVNSDVAIVASGTATVEAALAGVPTVVVYRLSRVSYLIARLLVRGVKFFAMPNLIAGRKILPELLQDEVSPERIAEEIERFLGDPAYVSRTKAALSEVRQRLETGDDAAHRAALLAQELIG